MRTEQRLPKGWWKSLSFDFGIHYPCPYIWFAYWLITWDNYEWAGEKKLWRIGNFVVPKISISFMPD